MANDDDDHDDEQTKLFVGSTRNKQIYCCAKIDSLSKRPLVVAVDGGDACRCRSACSANKDAGGHLSVV